MNYSSNNFLSRYHAVRAVGLDRELTKTFSRRLHWRDLACVPPWLRCCDDAVS
jgi:hypothetical protein